MAYNLMAEFSTEPDWGALRQLAATLEAVECFPIPGDATAAPAVGISLPGKAANVHGWTELERRLLTLWDDHRARVFDLYSAREIQRADRAEIRTSLLGPG